LFANVLRAYEDLFGEWQAIIDHLERMQLMDAPSIKSIIDGKQLSKELGGVKPGMWMKPALDLCMEWQLRNPGAEGYEGAVEEVRSRSEELKIPLGN
jgi:tRNA nucleotidyltransferase (CCA-adding enzyme)